MSYQCMEHITGLLERSNLGLEDTIFLIWVIQDGLEGTNESSSGISSHIKLL